MLLTRSSDITNKNKNTGQFLANQKGQWQQAVEMNIEGQKSRCSHYLGNMFAEMIIPMCKVHDIWPQLDLVLSHVSH